MREHVGTCVLGKHLLKSKLTRRLERVVVVVVAVVVVRA
jgi:hypothetical protein